MEPDRLDVHAETYDSSAGQLNERFFSRTAARHLRRLAGPPPVLMLGLGDGLVARDLASLYGSIDVVEGSRSLVTAVGTLPGVTTYVALFEDFEPRRPLGTVVAVHVLEHVQDPVRILRRAGEWLAPGGRLIVTVPNADSIHRRIGVALGMMQATDELNEGDLALGHRRAYNMQGFMADLRSAGLDVEDSGGFHLKVVSNAQMAGWTDDLLDAVYSVSSDLPPEITADLWAVCSSPNSPASRP